MSKGTKRRPELVKGSFETNWERTFGKKEQRVCQCTGMTATVNGRCRECGYLQEDQA